MNTSTRLAYSGDWNGLVPINNYAWFRGGKRPTDRRSDGLKKASAIFGGIDIRSIPDGAANQDQLTFCVAHSFQLLYKMQSITFRVRLCSFSQQATLLHLERCAILAGHL